MKRFNSTYNPQLDSSNEIWDINSLNINFLYAYLQSEGLFQIKKAKRLWTILKEEPEHDNATGFKTALSSLKYHEGIRYMGLDLIPSGSLSGLNQDITSGAIVYRINPPDINSLFLVVREPDFITYEPIIVQNEDITFKARIGPAVDYDYQYSTAPTRWSYKISGKEIADLKIKIDKNNVYDITGLNFLRSGDIYQVQVLYENEPVMVPFTVTNTKEPNYTTNKMEYFIEIEFLTFYQGYSESDLQILLDKCEIIVY